MVPMENELWKIRFLKPYEGAHNHVLVGRVLERDAVSVRLLCRTFHYGRVVLRLRDIRVGPVEKRIVPWHRIEIIHVLPASFELRRAELASDHDGNFVLFDGLAACVIAPAPGRQLSAQPMATTFSTCRHCGQEADHADSACPQARAGG